MERLSCWPALHERTARTFVFVVNAMCALVVEGVTIGVVSTQYDSIINSSSCAILLSNNTLSTYCRVGAGQAAHRTFVLQRAIGEVVIMHVALMKALFCFLNTLNTTMVIH